MSKYLLFIFILFSAQTLFSQETKYVNTELLNVRSGPGKNYEVLDTAPKGEKIKELSKEGNWTKIQMDSGITGFVSSKFLTNTQPASKKANTGSGTWWKAILGIIGFLFFVKIFGSKKTSTAASGDYSKPFKTKQNIESSSVAQILNIPSKEKSASSTKPNQNKEKLCCKFCGREESNLFFLTSGKCSKSSNNYHQPFEGGKRNSYACKFCGRKENNLFFLTSAKCSKSPNNYHQPYI